MKTLTDKLAAALLNTSAKEDLVKQHAKVAEEAVSGIYCLALPFHVFSLEVVLPQMFIITKKCDMHSSHNLKTPTKL